MQLERDVNLMPQCEITREYALDEIMDSRCRPRILSVVLYVGRPWKASVRGLNMSIVVELPQVRE